MLRNVPIRSKVIAIVLVPLLGMLIAASVAIQTSVTRSWQAGRVSDLSRLAVKATALVHELQGERTLSSEVVDAHARGERVPSDGMVAQRAVVDQAAADLRASAAGLDTSRYRPRLRQAMDRALGQLDGLQDQRQTVDRADRGYTADDAEGYYDATVSALLDLNADIAVGSNDEELIRTVTAFVALSRLKDAADLERGFRISDLLDPGLAARQERFKRFQSFVTLQSTWRAQFQNGATPEQQAIFARDVSGSDASRAGQIEAAALRGDDRALAATVPGDRERLDRIWFAAMTGRLNQLRAAERELASGLIATSLTSRDAADRRALLYVAALAAFLAVTVALCLLIARSMVRPLRSLRAAADEVASSTLPGVVERLQQGRADLEAAAPPPVIAPSRDEIGQVAEAFNAVHRVAIGVAAEQAALRKSIGDMFLNLARRSQSLVDRALELIDDLERDETSPDTLQGLFQLDHLATRMRRNAENLIVLSGAELSQSWTRPVALDVVLRAAIAEVEDYRRVELLAVDELDVSGHASVDVIHLLAELVENATVFSAPDTKVLVAGQQASNGYVVEIEDLGLGMGDEELYEANRRLADPPAVDAALSRMLGLHVVARLAARHGIKVQLRHSWYGGLTALVLLPERLLTWPGAPDRALPEPGRVPAIAAPVSSPMPILQSAAAGGLGDGTGNTYLPLRRHGPGQPHLEPRDHGAVPPPAYEPPRDAPLGMTTAGMTTAGLPRRPVQARGPAPGAGDAWRGTDPGPRGDPPDASLRSAEAVRNRLTSYRAGLERGRRTASEAGAEHEDDRLDQPARRDTPPDRW